MSCRVAEVQVRDFSSPRDCSSPGRFSADETLRLALGTYGEDEVVRLEPFDAIELELRALWPETVTPLPKP